MAKLDEVDRIVAAWERAHPDLDFAPLQIFSRLRRLAKHLELARRATFDSSSLAPWEFDVLSALRRAGAPFQASPKALMRQTFVSSGTMTNRIDRLSLRGLVTRQTDPEDGRGVQVAITPAGIAVVDQAIGELVLREKAMLKNLAPQEQEQLATLLRELGQGLLSEVGS